jgi:hypothetical protein
VNTCLSGCAGPDFVSYPHPAVRKTAKRFARGGPHIPNRPWLGQNPVTSPAATLPLTA